MIKNDLLKLDFTSNQADIYLSLREIGPTKVGQLISKTGFHRSIIYRGLEELMARKLVFKTSRNGTNYYSISRPDHLLNEYDQKRELALDIVKKLEQSNRQNTPDIFVLTGEEGIEELFELNLASKKDILLIGTNYIAQKDYPEMYLKYEEKLLKRNIKRFVLAYPERKKDASLIKSAETRFLPKSFPQSPLVINIFGNSVAHTLWMKPQVTTLLTDKVVSDGYRNYFKLLWDQADKI